MKSCEDFLSTLTQKDAEAAVQKAVSALSSSGATYSAEEMRLALAITQASAFGYKELLRLYHNWLMEQM